MRSLSRPRAVVTAGPERSDCLYQTDHIEPGLRQRQAVLAACHFLQLWHNDLHAIILSSATAHVQRANHWTAASVASKWQGPSQLPAKLLS